MRFESLRLDDVLRRELAIAWHEGVSVMQAICRQLPDASSASARFPLASEVGIAPDGTVSLLHKASGSPGVTAAGQLLGEMLQADVPVKLRLIHSEAVATTPSFATIKDLSDALAYFERPDAQQAIQELYVKAAAKPAQHEELNLVELEDFLPETPSAADAQRPEPQLSVVKPDAPPPAGATTNARAEAPPSERHHAARRRQTGLIAVAVVVAFAVVASGAFLTYGREQPEAPGDVEAADPTSAGTAPVESGLTAKQGKTAKVQTAAATMRSDAKPVSQPAPDKTSAPAHANEPSAGADTHVAADAIATTLTSQSTVPDPSWAASLPLIVREPIERQLPVPAATDSNGEFVYSRVNREVAPPVAIRPHLPSEPPADYVSDHLMVLDLVVTSRGDVESVRLLTPPKTINDFMIVSAAKAWLFAPAKLNGRPVKYKHRIRFIVP